MKTKKIFTFIFPALFLLMLVSCSKPAFDTSLLIGEWETEQTEYEDGMSMTLKMKMEFSSSTDVALKMDLIIAGINFGGFKASGTYKVHGDIVRMDIPEENVKLTLDRDLFDSQAEYNAMKKELISDLYDEPGNAFEATVKSISSTTLVWVEDEDTYYFEKI